MITSRSTRRLARSYLLVIMVLSLLFSGIIFAVVSAQLDRPFAPHWELSPAESERQFHQRWQRHNQEARQSVIMGLVVLNGLMLVGGAALSIVLARRTLRPIEQALQQQAQFVSDASHELRTPLAALLVRNQVALRKKVLSEAKARAVLQDNVTEIDKLTALANSLLALAAGHQQRESPQVVQVEEFLSHIVAELQPLAHKKHIMCRSTTSTTQAVFAPVAAKQIITILLDNALKYSPPQTEVSVQVSQRSKTLQIAVRDQGPGIALKDQAHIFDRFYRADTARTRTHISGHGLGLAIARQIAIQYGWRLGVVSQPGQGATFMLQISQADKMKREVTSPQKQS